MDNNIIMRNETALHPHVILASHFMPNVSELKQTSPRSVQYYETSVYTTDGGYLYVNDKEYALHKWAVRFVKPGDIVYSKPYYNCMTLVLDFGNEGSYDSTLLRSIPSFFDTVSKTVDIYREIIQLYHSSKPGDKLYMNALILKLLYDFYNSTVSSRHPNPKIEQCLNYMQTNYRQNITLSTLSDISGYVPLHTLRLFKEATGKTPHDHLTDIRMFAARKKLDENQLSISEIAYDCGFQSVSHFQVLFKKYYGITPGKYRHLSDSLNR